ncbi:MAG: hypothetical protein GQ570_00585 [Helicobacteraceae bacterium]|nr:hypothetical protein [Helicobacteraceae bacterium]
MQEKFSEEYPKFKAKIHNFIVSTNFVAQQEEYEKLFDQMANIAIDDIKEIVEKSPKFLDIRNRTLQYMERIVEIYRELDEIFKMDEITLGLKCKYNLATIDKQIAEYVQESAKLIFHYKELSDQGREIVDSINSPFFQQNK